MVIVTLFTKAKLWIQFIGRITGVEKKNVAISSMEFSDVKKTEGNGLLGDECL